MLGLFYRTYGEATVINFALPAYNGQDLNGAATFAAGDVKVSLDQAAEVNAANLPTDRGNWYSLTLSAAELTCARLTVLLIDQTVPNVWLPDYFIVETTQHPLSQHPDPLLLDMGTTQATGAQTVTLRVGAPATPKGALVVIGSGAVNGANQVGVVASRVGDVVTLEQSWADAGGVTPSSPTTYKVYAAAPAPVAIAADMVRVNGDATSAARMAKSARSIITGLVQAGTLTVNTFTTNLGGSVAEQYDDRMIAFLETTATVALRGVTKPIDSFTPGSPSTLSLGYRDNSGALVQTPLPAVPSAGDEFVVI